MIDGSVLSPPPDATLPAPDLALIAGKVLASLGVHAAPAANDPRPGGRLATAAVDVTGSCDTYVTVACRVATARRLAARMFGVDRRAIRPHDVADALGELANMVGGNVKETLPPPYVLSLPRVVLGPRTHHRPGACCLLAASLASSEGPITVGLWSHPARKQP